MTLFKIEEAERDPAEEVAAGEIKTAKTFEGLEAISPLLTSNEMAALRQDTAQRLRGLYESLPSEKEFVAAALAGKPKKGWYGRSARAISGIFGVEAPRFAALLAALSPQTSVETNLMNTLNTWAAWLEAGRPTDEAAIRKVLGASVVGGKGEESVLDAWINNSVRALAAEDGSEVVLSGPKVDSFMRNLTGDVNAVTLDTWMAKFVAWDQPMLKGKLNASGARSNRSLGYLALTAKVRLAAQAATKLTGELWTPAEIQETVWTWAKALTEAGGVAGEKRTLPELVTADRPTTNEMLETPDFDVLFTQGVYRDILERAGLNQEERNAEAGQGPGDQQAGQGDGNEQPAQGGEGSAIDPGAIREHLLAAAERLEKVRNQEEPLLKVEDAYASDNQPGVTLGLRPGRFADSALAPFTHPTGPVDLELVRRSVVDALSSRDFAEYIKERYGLEHLTLHLTEGTWLGESEPNIVIQAPGLSFEQSQELASLLGIALSQESTIAWNNLPADDKETWRFPVIYIGKNERLTEAEVEQVGKELNDAGFDYSTTVDGTGLKYALFVDEGADADAALAEASKKI